ncbi:MAG: right-handed parallel beta-helix repeat-containing protein [Pirellulales bacterium]
MTRSISFAAVLLAGAVVWAGIGAAQAAQAGRTFYVSATSGDDRQDGLAPRSAWRTLDKVNATDLQPGDQVLFCRGQTWRGTLVPHRGGEGAPITYGAYGEGPKPMLLGSVSRSAPGDWHREAGDTWATADLPVDVGNIIFDHGQSAGVKRWRPEDLRQPGDYWYSGDTRQVKLVSKQNPAEAHRSIELALRRHIVDQGGKSYVVYEDLSLRYGAAHGIGGGNTHHIVVRDCDVAWIGGGHQLTTPDGRPVRFGNGIEFWENSHDNLVENCRIWEVYDAALTNQGSANNSQLNITYRGNVIWNCEYSFEYWNRGPESTTRNIRFEHNTCVDAGRGWGHAQRPDPNGRHLMFYSNSARMSEFYVRDNIFSTATDSCLRMENDWTAGLTMDRNCWFQPGPVLAVFARTSFAPSRLADFQKRTGLEAHSIVAEPKFVDAARLDFRLAGDSPAKGIAGEGEPAGAGKRARE